MEFPATINISASLDVTIHLHQFFLGDRDRQCWSYITRGLRKYDQQEMCLSLLLEDEDDPGEPPQVPVKMFRLLEGYAEKDRLVTAGEATRLGKSGFFGFTDLYYVNAVQFQGLPDLTDHLAIMLVHPGEYDFAHRYGFSRLATRIGKFCGTFPYPTWNSRQRPGISNGDAENSLLNGTRVLARHGISVIFREHAIQVTVAEASVPIALQDLNDLDQQPNGVAWLLDLPADMNACLYWEPGQASPGAYTAPNTSLICGVTFLGLKSHPVPGIGLLEDGFHFELDQEKLNALAASIERGEGGFKLGRYQVSVVVTDSVMAGDAFAYAPQAAWTSITTASSGVRLVQLGIDNRDTIAESTLKQFVTEVTRVLEKSMQDETTNLQLTIRTGIRGAGTHHDIEADIELNPEFIEFMRHNLPYWPTEQDALVVEMVYDINR